MKNKLEVIIFADKTFREIPKQNNPTFDITNYSGVKQRVKECLLICKVADPKYSGVKNGYTVIFVPFKGEITSKGRFWDIEPAVIFANAYANK